MCGHKGGRVDGFLFRIYYIHVFVDIVYIHIYVHIHVVSYFCTFVCDHRAGMIPLQRTAQRDILTRWVNKNSIFFSDDDEAVRKDFPIEVSSLTAAYSRRVVKRSC
jgi:hypothetical protein